MANQRDHDQVDGAAEAAEFQSDGDFQITQGDCHGGEDGALAECKKLLETHNMPPKNKIPHCKPF